MYQYATYTKFYSPEDAEFLIALLQQHDITYSLEHEVNQLDRVYIGEAIEAMFALQIPNNRFNDVHALLAEQAKSDLDQPGFEHYLQSYTIAELQEILDNPGNWNAYDLQVATTLLSIKTEGQVIVKVNEAVSNEPVKLDKKWIVLGYLACVFGFTNFFFIGAAGFFSGLAINQAKQTLKNGNMVKMYTTTDRMHGRIMMALSVLFTTGGAILLYIRYY